MCKMRRFEDGDEAAACGMVTKGRKDLVNP
jgi:hypothetical protein